jgi:hypothetical protein
MASASDHGTIQVPAVDNEKRHSCFTETWHPDAGNNPMANLIEIRNGTVVNNDDPNDTYLPIDTPIARPDGHYVAIGMDVEGPFGQDEARGRLDHLKKATRMELEDEDRRKQEN